LSVALISIPHSLPAQISPVNLSGSVKGPSGSAITTAKVIAKNLNTTATQESHTDSVGNFGFSLEPGAYELSITADGFESKTAMVTIVASAAQSLTFTLAPLANSTGDRLPNAPSATQTGPSLSDLGFPPEQTQSNTKEQALLDKRTHMLKIHQKLGLITAAPLLATFSERLA
jgi:hypothetical protein